MTAAESSSGSPAGVAYLRKLTAVERVATDILSRIEKILRENPTAISDTRATMLPHELEDKQAYFLERIAHTRKTLAELAGLLSTGSQEAPLHEQISAELMAFFVLIECFRPHRIRASGWTQSEAAEVAIRESVESLVLDVVSMRERLR